MPSNAFASRHTRGRLTKRMQRFAQEYAHLGIGVEAARRAGYSDSSDAVLNAMACENLQKPAIRAEIARLEAMQQVDVTAHRVQRRLHAISHAAEAAGQFGPAVRAEELLGKSIGMWIDQSLQLSGTLNDGHVAALLQIARERQAQPIDLSDTETVAISHANSHSAQLEHAHKPANTGLSSVAAYNDAEDADG